MTDEINLNLFWKLTDQVNWSKKGDVKYLKVWVNYDDLEEFVKLTNVDAETMLDCTLLRYGVYIEFYDLDVQYNLGFESVDDFIERTEIEEY